jgi:hypothetical protein
LLKRVAVGGFALLAFVAGPLGMGRALAGQDFAAMTNADRTSHGLRALSGAGDLQSLAQQRADQMARSGQLAHTTNLGSKVSGWQRLGENVGRGPALPDIETAFMNSPTHRENILDPSFTQLGVGVTWDGGKYFYVAVIFRQPSGAAPAAAPAPTPAPAPRPAPAPAPRTAAAPKPAPKPVTTTTRPPTPTTTEPPTTTTTTAAPAVAAPPPPPVEETTTTTAPRPIYANKDFLAANFSDTLTSVPAAMVRPLHRSQSVPLLLALTAAFSIVGVSGGIAAVYRAQAARRF